MAKNQTVDEPLAERNHPDRRLAYFTDMADVTTKAPKLQRAVREWISLRDA